MRPRNPVLLLLLGAAVSGAGCYTLVRHPSVTELTSTEGERKACADCHADAEFYHETAYGDEGWYDYYPEPWAGYYEFPWWYNDYWYVAPPVEGPLVPTEVGGRHAWSRNSGGPGFIPIQGDQDVENPTKPLPGDTPDKPEKPKDDKDKDKDKKDKDKRRLWGR